MGAGGLGSPAALYLAAAGVGRIGIVDFDVVDESNLQRQILHDTSWVGRPKLESAVARLSALNPHVAVEPHPVALTRENALALLAGYDVVVDGTDNFETRYLTNDACYFLKKPNVYGSIFRFEGQVSVFWADRGPATGVSSRSRRPRASCRAARRGASSASFPASSGASRPPRPSRSCWESGSLSWAACSSTTRSPCVSTRCSSRATRSARCAHRRPRSASCRTTRPSAGPGRGRGWREWRRSAPLS